MSSKIPGKSGASGRESIGIKKEKSQSQCTDKSKDVKEALLGQISYAEL